MDSVDPHGKGARMRAAARAVLVLLLLAACAQAAAAPLPIRFDRFDQESGLSQLAVNAIAQDAAGFLWLGTEEGLDQFDGYAFHPARHDRLDKASLRQFHRRSGSRCERQPLGRHRRRRRRAAQSSQRRIRAHRAAWLAACARSAARSHRATVDRRARASAMSINAWVDQE